MQKLVFILEMTVNGPCLFTLSFSFQNSSLGYHTGLLVTKSDFIYKRRIIDSMQQDRRQTVFVVKIVQIRS
jgi:hypothetical protein